MTLKIVLIVHLFRFFDCHTLYTYGKLCASQIDTHFGVLFTKKYLQMYMKAQIATIRAIFLKKYQLYHIK